MIDAQTNLQLVFEESSAEIALEKIPNLLVDVIVLDHRLKGFDGVLLAHRLVDAFSEKGELCPTIIITGTYATPKLVMAAIRCGATDVVTQDAPMSELLRAINNTQRAQMYSNFASFEDILSHADYQAKPDPLFILRRSRLEESQKEILNYLEAGIEVKEISIRMAIESKALGKILEKLLINLHFATYEQLYLSLHDSRLGNPT
jgi:DNA-binding NarL/FixJ family response regulator